MKLDQIKRALKAKLSSKEDMPDWYYLRLSKCLSCEFNSGNKEKLSLVDKLRISHNFGKDACLKCTCGIEDKCSDSIESCPEGFWNSIEEKLDYLNIYTEDNSKEFKWNKDTKKYTLDYGDIPFKSDSSVVVFITDKELSNLSVVSSCGCTTANPKYSIKGVEIEIKYDTKRVGGFSKNITITYSKNNSSKKTIINIKGTVKNSN